MVYLKKLIDTSSNYQNTDSDTRKKNKNKKKLYKQQIFLYHDFHVYLVCVCSCSYQSYYTCNLLLEYVYLIVKLYEWGEIFTV